MQCARCKKDFPDVEVRPPSLVLRVLAFPFFLIYMLKSLIVLDEMQAAYCRPCRRQIHACLFFGAALLGIGLLAWGVAVYLRSMGAR